MNENHVHVEREKTKRTLIVAIAITVVGLVCAVLFFQNIDNRGGALKITKDGVEVSLEKPIANQVNADTVHTKVLGNSIVVTGGTVTDIDIEGGQDSGGFIGKRFNGKNLIDTAVGFVLASDLPSKWQVQTPSDGSGVVKRLTAADGSLIELRKTPARGLPPLDEFVKHILDSVRSIDPKAKELIDSLRPDNMRMVWYTNPDTKRAVCLKIIDANGQRYIIDASTANADAKKSVAESAAGFVVIEKQAAAVKVAPATKRLLR